MSCGFSVSRGNSAEITVDRPVNHSGKAGQISPQLPPGYDEYAVSLARPRPETSDEA